MTETIKPSKQQLDSVLDLLELDGVNHKQASAHFASFGWSQFSDVEPIQIKVPGTKTFQFQGHGFFKIIPHGPSGLTVKAHYYEGNSRPGALQIELYAMDDFDAVTRETADQIVNQKVIDAIRSVQGAFGAQDILEMFKSSLENSDLGAVFKADRSAAIMQDSIEQAPEKPVKAFFTRGR